MFLISRRRLASMILYCPTTTPTSVSQVLLYSSSWNRPRFGLYPKPYMPCNFFQNQLIHMKSHLSADSPLFAPILFWASALRMVRSPLSLHFGKGIRPSLSAAKISSLSKRLGCVDMLLSSFMMKLRLWGEHPIARCLLIA